MPRISKVNSQMRANLLAKNTPKLKIEDGNLYYWREQWWPLTAQELIGTLDEIDATLTAETGVRWTLTVIDFGEPVGPVLALVEI